MLTVILWLWTESGVKRTYTPAHVNAMVRMIRRNYRGEVRFVCITDEKDDTLFELDTDFAIYPLWDDAREYKQPRGKSFPACYHRLKIFDPKTTQDIAAYCFGHYEQPLGRCVSVDIDAVICADVTDLWKRDEPFVGWRVTNGLKPRVYNGSCFLFDSEEFAAIWSSFIADPEKRIGMVNDAGFRYGSDQSVMAFYLGQNKPHWTAADGVLSWRLDKLAGRDLPKDAKIVFFHGDAKPWDKDRQRVEWIKTHWG